MSETATTTTTPETAPTEQSNAATEADQQQDNNREAAKYRRQLRDAEAQRDQLAARLQTMQRTEVERLVADQLAKPAALWAAGVQLADLVNEAGDIDPAKVAIAVTAAIDALGLSRGADPTFTTGAQGHAVAPAAGWADVLRSN